jgi:small multidrug resistance pump
VVSKILIAIYVLIASSALIALKLGSKDGAPIQVINSKLLLNFAPLAVTGIALYGLSFLLYTFLISRYDLGYIIPLTTALVYVIIFTASFVIFHEVFTMFKILGIVFIVLGLILLNLKN